MLSRPGGYFSKKALSFWSTIQYIAIYICVGFICWLTVWLRSSPVSTCTVLIMFSRRFVIRRVIREIWCGIRVGLCMVLSCFKFIIKHMKIQHIIRIRVRIYDSIIFNKNFHSTLTKLITSSFKISVNNKIIHTNYFTWTSRRIPKLPPRCPRTTRYLYSVYPSNTDCLSIFRPLVSHSMCSPTISFFFLALSVFTQVLVLLFFVFPTAKRVTSIPPACPSRTFRLVYELVRSWNSHRLG